MKKKISLFLFFLFVPYIGYAATGNVLFSCNFDGSGSTPAQVWTNCGGSSSFGPLGLSSGTIVTGGHDGKKAISFYYPNSNTPNELSDPMTANYADRPEITLVYWERFSVDPNNSWVWNVKSSRTFLSDVYPGYMGGLNSLHNHGEWDQAFWSSGTLTTTAKVTDVYVSSPPPPVGEIDGGEIGYCGPGSNNTYPCNNGLMSLSWAPSWGTSWHKIRAYMKAPSSASASDGIVKVWIDESLIYTLSNIKGRSNWSPNFIFTSFHPSDDFLSSGGFPFHHLYDDIAIYEGYVPPTSGEVLASPINLRIASQ